MAWLTKPERTFNTAPQIADLEPASSLVPSFQAIRAYAAANAAEMTRDEAILEELTKLLHAKIHDELVAQRGRPLRFYALAGEPPGSTAARIRELHRVVALDGGNGEQLLFDDKVCRFAVEQLQGWKIVGAARDVVGEAYETLIFPALRGGQGQFFTPRNVVSCMVSLVNPGPGEAVIDPACGTGGFLAEACTQELASGHELGQIAGVDKDSLLARMAQDSLRLRFGKGEVVSNNSLLPASEIEGRGQIILRPGSYDVVLTNPPFGSRIPVAGELLAGYELAYEWKYSKSDRSWNRTQRLRDSVPPQVLFVELCWRLLQEGGRCGIVLPEGLLGNESTGHVRQWLLERADILAVIDCPIETFLPSTSTKTAILVFEKRQIPRRTPIFMAVAEKCGHDRRGKPLIVNGLPDDDFPRIASAFREQAGVRT